MSYEMEQALDAAYVMPTFGRSPVEFVRGDGMYLTDSEYVTFSVTDTGTGIPPEYSETIFERFEKADNFGQGTGLGLNICRLIAERLKGKVLLDKEYKEGAGSCLYCR